MRGPHLQQWEASATEPPVTPPVTIEASPPLHMRHGSVLPN